MSILMRQDNNKNETISFGVHFSDSKEHFYNAFVRLMQQDEKILRDFLTYPLDFFSNNNSFTLAEASHTLHNNWKDTLRRFGKDTSEISNVSIKLDTCFGELSFDKLMKIDRIPKFALAINTAIGFGVLVHVSDYSRVKNSEVDYEFEYFNGDIDGVGYGNLDNQSWRKEKAERLVKELQSILVQVGSNLPLQSMSVLDMGAGYGHFLHELKKIGSTVYGLDISKHASQVARDKFGISISQQTISEFSKLNKEKFHLVTMWDYIEHLDNPLDDLFQTYNILHNGGYLLIKTPSLNALEFEVFGSYYHSLKREHLNYFSPNSLTQLLNVSGFQLKMKYGISHMFQGLLAGNLTSLAVANGKESDFLLIAQKKS